MMGSVKGPGTSDIVNCFTTGPFAPAVPIFF
jgi:hypothetical protein